MASDHTSNRRRHNRTIAGEVDASRFPAQTPAYLRPTAQFKLLHAAADCLGASAQEHAISFRWRPMLSDPDDDFILELAVAADAGYIVTYNLRNFAGVERFGLEAITPAQMLLKLQEVKRYENH
jgi:predicted nucleic acid-binding protein